MKTNLGYERLSGFSICVCYREPNSPFIVKFFISNEMWLCVSLSITIDAAFTIFIKFIALEFTSF